MAVCLLREKLLLFLVSVYYAIIGSRLKPNVLRSFFSKI